jgi:hypothetical protein
MKSVHQRLGSVADSIAKLPSPGDKLSKEQLKQARLRRDAIQRHLKLAQVELQRAGMLTDTERAIYARIIALKLSELTRIFAAAGAPPQKPDAEKESPQNKREARAAPSSSPPNKPAPPASTPVPKDSAPATSGTSTTK